MDLDRCGGLDIVSVWSLAPCLPIWKILGIDLGTRGNLVDFRLRMVRDECGGKTKFWAEIFSFRNDIYNGLHATNCSRFQLMFNLIWLVGLL